MTAITERMQAALLSLAHRAACARCGATLDGRFADAERLAQEALELGAAAPERVRDVRLPLCADARDPVGAGPPARALARDPGPRRALPVDPAVARRARRRRARRRAGGTARARAPRRTWLRGAPARRALDPPPVRARRGVRARRRHASAACSSTSSCSPTTTTTPSPTRKQPFGPVALRLGKLAALLGRWQDDRSPLRDRARPLRAALRAGDPRPCAARARGRPGRARRACRPRPHRTRCSTRRRSSATSSG